MNNPYFKTLEPLEKSLEHVSINQKKLKILIKEMKRKNKKDELIVPDWAVENAQPPLDCKIVEWINFICWINAVNFAFTNFKPPYNKFTIEYPKGNSWRGAFALEASFMRAQSEGMPVYDPEYMAKISLEDVKHLFRAIDDDHQIPMIKERWAIFHEVGRVLLEHFDGSWFDLFYGARWYAFDQGEGIVEQIVDFFPSFRDEREYQGHHLKFNKRAQLLVMMYYGRAVNSRGTLPMIRDIEDIGPIADYEVPKALRFLEVLQYSPAMELAIQNRQVIRPGHPWETESRLAMSYAMKMICDEAGINMAEADFYIWNMGRASQDPHILVPTTDY